ncbi:DUF4071 domain-containing protein [Candidatus Fermentibacterales bacterium]|nr:DUF4071 domain-containing protein [Candidatus Fermentibacterales bacterium]
MVSGSVDSCHREAGGGLPDPFNRAVSLHRGMPDSGCSPGGPEQHIALVQELVGSGENLMACDVCNEALRTWGGNVRLRQLKALALARSGATASALSILTRLEEEGHCDHETIGLLGSIHKDLWMRESDPSRRRVMLERARGYYGRGLTLPDAGYWSGINAATLALAAGDPAGARELAGRVRRECSKRLEEAPSGDYWAAATMGEACLILGDAHAASGWYATACSIAGNRLGDIASTRRNAVMILGFMSATEEDLDLIGSAFTVPRIIVFAGHMIDRPGRAFPRFPPGLEPGARDELRKRLGGHDRVIGFSSAACGADILFLEQLGEMGAETHVVLPFEEQQFIEESVVYAQDGAWVPRFRRVMERARTITIASPCKTDDTGLAFEYSNMILLGLAMMKRRELEGSILAMALWDGLPGDGFGGTRSNVRRWQDAGLEIELIGTGGTRLDDTTRDALSVETAAEGAGVARGEAGFSRPEVRALMFADLVGYTRLSESEIVSYVKSFMGSVSVLAASSDHSPLFSNTWGDGLFMVFADVRDAGVFALDLLDMVDGKDWSRMGLRRAPSLRVALHAGPVQLCEDPITGRPGYFGSHVGTAARIEPITEPGHVYASGHFAALAECGMIGDFRCDYVGRLPLSKSYGSYPTYHVRRT